MYPRTDWQSSCLSLVTKVCCIAYRVMYEILKEFSQYLIYGFNIVKTRVYILLGVWLWGECAFSMCPGFCPQHPKSKAEKDKCADS